MPGVPENEHYFVAGPGIPIVDPPGFATRSAAEEYLRGLGITEFDFEPFEL